MFRSIKNKLIFLFLIAVLTPLLVMRLIAYPSAQKVIQETTIGNLQSISSKKVSQVNDWWQKLETTAERIANNPLVSADDKLIGLNISDVQGFHRALNGKTYISDIVASVFCDSDEFGNRYEQLPAMYVFAPAKNEDGHVVG